MSCGCAAAQDEGKHWKRDVSLPPGHKGKQTGPLWFLQQKARSRGELERAVRGDALVLALLSVWEAERELRA